MRDFYKEQSANRYTVSGDITTGSRSLITRQLRHERLRRRRLRDALGFVNDSADAWRRTHPSDSD